MGVKSTHYVTREQAIKLLLERIDRGLRNSTLADMLEVALDDGDECFMNFIVKDIMGEDDHPRLEV